MNFHLLICLFVFKTESSEKLQDFLAVPELPIKFKFMSFKVFLKLNNFFFFIIIMLDLSIVEKSSSILIHDSFLFLERREV